MPASGFLRDLGAAFLAVLAAVLPARAGWSTCPEAGPPGRGVLACCTAPEGAPADPCCCQEGAPERPEQAAGEAQVSAPRCDCSTAPAPPERPARPADVALELGRELQAQLTALVLALAPERPAAPGPTAPCAGREPPGFAAPPEAQAGGGPARLHLLAVARL